jgi:hypothetical protein
VPTLKLAKQKVSQKHTILTSSFCLAIKNLLIRSFKLVGDTSVEELPFIAFSDLISLVFANVVGKVFANTECLKQQLNSVNVMTFLSILRVPKYVLTF